jgi:hypothetical protein
MLIFSCRAVPLDSPSPTAPNSGYKITKPLDHTVINHVKHSPEPEDSSNSTEILMAEVYDDQQADPAHSRNSSPKLLSQADVQGFNLSSASSATSTNSSEHNLAEMAPSRSLADDGDQPASPVLTATATNSVSTRSFSRTTNTAGLVDNEDYYSSDDGRRATYDELIKYPPIPPTFISPAMQFPPDRGEASVMHRFPTKRTARRWAIYLASPEAKRDPANRPRHPNEDHIQEPDKGERAKLRAQQVQKVQKVQKAAPKAATVPAKKTVLGAAKVEKSKGKSRLTRSHGCLTCRHRKLKCDETHPVCDACSRGYTPRDCVWESKDAGKSSGPRESSYF